MALRGERRGGWTKFEIAQEKFSFQCKKSILIPQKSKISESSTKVFKIFFIFVITSTYREVKVTGHSKI